MQKEMKNKVTRLLYELNSLDKGTIHLSDMAVELGVSVRTLQRDMNDIQEADFPLWNPVPGAYAFIEGFSLEKMRLSGTEASILVLMSDLASSLGENFGNSFELLKTRLLARPADNPFFIKMNGGEKYKDTPITRTLEQAIRQRESITFTYKGNRLSQYTVQPLKLAWMDGFWYLISLADGDKILKFSLDKITSAKTTNKTFKYTRTIDKLLRESTNIWFEKDRPLSVTLEVSARCATYFKRKTYFPLQKVEKEHTDGRIVLSCQATKAEEVLPTILYWLPHIKVLSPSTLSEHLNEILQGYLQGTK